MNCVSITLLSLRLNPEYHKMLLNIRRKTARKCTLRCRSLSIFTYLFISTATQLVRVFILLCAETFRAVRHEARGEKALMIPGPRGDKEQNQENDSKQEAGFIIIMGWKAGGVTVGGAE